jgi:hypothetical protein
MLGAFESPASRFEIRHTPMAEFANFVKLLTNHLSLFK